MQANKIYQNIIRTILQDGTAVETRNHRAVKHPLLPEFTLTSTPLITLRRTAWRKAVREWEWFMSGSKQCPEDLLDWWDGQLSPQGNYIDGYGEQFRNATGRAMSTDQVWNLLYGLRNHPHSRRHVLTTWNAADMAYITTANSNPRTPTCCHGTTLQFHVTGRTLHLYHYQRSADVLLGLPHNLIQYWAFLLYVAHHTSLVPGQLTYKLGDAHIYDEPSHLEAAKAIIEAELPDTVPDLHYKPSNQLPGDETGLPKFSLYSFEMTGDVPPPATTVRPTLL